MPFRPVSIIPAPGCTMLRSTATGRWLSFLIERGAIVNIKDTKVGSTAAGWADYGGHPELKDYLDKVSRGKGPESQIQGED